MSDPDTPPSDSLRAFLATRDVPCPCCNYNLRALPGSRCPECNQELVLQVGLVEPKLAWFVTGLVGIGMGFGFSALLLGYALFHGLLASRAGVPNEFVPPVITGTLVGAALLALWLFARRRFFAAKPATTRWSAALLASTLGLVCPLWFILTVK